jgi:PAS domain S-box-containing protein
MTNAAAQPVDPDLDNKLCSLLIARVRDYAIFMLNPEGRVMTWNDGARLIKGYTRDEIIGQSMTRFYTAEDQENGRPQELLQKAMRNGRAEDEGWRVRKDGTRFWADVVITAVKDDTGKLLGFAKITRDLTERRKAEAAIGELSGRLFMMQDEERQRLASQLHDRTSVSLTAVLGSLYRVKAHLKSPDVVLLKDVDDSIARVEGASDVIRRVAGMLHPSRLEQSGLVDTLRWYVNAMSGVLLSVRAELPAKPIPMPAECEIVLFRLVQECLNYIVARGGSREVVVRLSAKLQLVLEVAITGATQFGLQDALGTGAGFAGVRERLRMLGGTLKSVSGGDQTVIEATLTVSAG